MRIPPAGAVHVRRADHHRGQPRAEDDALALLLGASVRRLHRQLALLGEQGAARVTRYNRGREHDARARARIGSRRGQACVHEVFGAVDVDFAHLARAAL